MEEKEHSKLKEYLDAQYAWPALYMFKFIAPADSVEEVENLFPKNELRRKSSKKGKYVSITAQLMMSSSNDIIKIYKKAHLIKGVIAL